MRVCAEKLDTLSCNLSMEVCHLLPLFVNMEVVREDVLTGSDEIVVERDGA